MLALGRDGGFIFIAVQGRASQLLCTCTSVSGQIVVDLKSQPVKSFGGKGQRQARPG